MSGRMHRMLRKTASQVAAENNKMIVPAMKTTWDNVEIALENEKATRGRVDDLEVAVRGHLKLPLLGRLKWLLLGL